MKQSTADGLQPTTPLRPSKFKQQGRMVDCSRMFLQNVVNQFTAVGQDPRATFFGNVALGRDVSLQELRSLYHGVSESHIQGVQGVKKRLSVEKCEC